MGLGALRPGAKAIAPAFAVAAGLLLGGAAPPLADQVRDYFARVVRVQTITRRIMAANLAVCPHQHGDFGFTAISPDPAASETARAAWVEALGLSTNGSTVVAVYPGGPASKAQLRVGDEIVAANGAAWSASADGRAAFVQSLRGSDGNAPLQLALRRGIDNLELTVPAQSICAGDAVLTMRDKVNAEARGSTIVVEGGLERLLVSDEELAWVIAHEAAHVFLGHTASERAEDRRKSASRKRMERDADMLGIRLMLRAGFAPEASFTAHPRIAAASRGPLSRMLDLHGPYMGTRERTEFLMAEVKAARAELGVAAPVDRP